MQKDRGKEKTVTGVLLSREERQALEALRRREGARSWSEVLRLLLHRAADGQKGVTESSEN